MPVLGYGYPQLCWMPIFILFIIKAVKKNRVINVWTLTAGISFGLFCLQQLAQGAVEGIVLIGLIWLVWIYMDFVYNCLSDAIERIKRMTMCFLVAGVIGVGIAAIYLFPILEQSPDLLRVGIDGFVGADKGVDISEFYAHEDTIDNIRNVFQGVHYHVLAMFFVILGLFSKRVYKGNAKKVLLNYGKVLFVVTLFMSTSIIAAEYLYYIPFVNRLRETHLYSVSFMPFAKTLLIAFGVESFGALLKHKHNMVYNYPLVLLIELLVVVHALLPVNATAKEYIFASTLLIIIIVLFFAYKIKPFRIVYFALMLCICIVNVYNVKAENYEKKYTAKTMNEQYQRVTTGYKQVFAPEDKTDAVAPYRVMTWGGVGKFSANAAANVGGYSTEGYWEPIYHKTLESHWDLDLAKRLILNNVKYFVVADCEEEAYLDWIHAALLDENFEFCNTIENIYPSYDADAGQTLLLYKNKNWIGEAWICYEYEEYSDADSEEDVFAKINAPDFDPSTKVLVNVADQKIADCLQTISSSDNSSKVTIEKYTNNKIQLTCSTQKNGILVLAESDAPGWNAYIDGKKVPVIECDYYRKGVYVEQGMHAIEFRYAPAGYLIGRIVTMTTLIGLLVAFVFLGIEKYKCACLDKIIGNNQEVFYDR